MLGWCWASVASDDQHQPSIGSMYRACWALTVSLAGMFKRSPADVTFVDTTPGRENVSRSPAMRRRTAVSGHLKSEQSLLFAFRLASGMADVGMARSTWLTFQPTTKFGCFFQHCKLHMSSRGVTKKMTVFSVLCMRYVLIGHANRYSHFWQYIAYLKTISVANIVYFMSSFKESCYMLLRGLTHSFLLWFSFLSFQNFWLALYLVHTLNWQGKGYYPHTGDFCIIAILLTKYNYVSALE